MNIEQYRIQGIAPAEGGLTTETKNFDLQALDGD